MTVREYENIVNRNHKRLCEEEFNSDIDDIKRLIAEDTSGADREGLLRARKAEGIQRVILGVMSGVAAAVALATITIAVI